MVVTNADASVVSTVPTGDSVSSTLEGPYAKTGSGGLFDIEVVNGSISMANPSAGVLRGPIMQR